MAARRTLSPRGFSLLEVLVSVTLFAIICSVLYSGFSMVTRSWRRGHENIQQSERLRSVFELIRRQVISIYPVVPVEEDTEADLAQPGPQRMIAAKIPYFVGSDQQVAFVTLFSLRLNAIPGLCFVAYGVEPSPSGDGLALVELEKPYTGISPLAADGVSSAPENMYRYTLLDRLEEVSFEFYGLDLSQAGVVPEEEQTKQWYPTWKVEEMGDLPEAVRIRYRFMPEAKMRFPEGEILVPIRSKGNLPAGRVPRRMPNATT
ncbi:MAG TPA: prepilin-type N-terminal cleavage/methylation domain-containing protein [Acidobacteriota bacterium]|nr:prepilin-type N-terminal cleavage/methylation domain-containing protein [Acidobacteriota bacterium]HNR39368.1 prepilin-type N-terminal cleavage/methylation domain-containing protein [Acidobacteriota bacterium]HNT99487.1 prepilin-type N-terminal cleavage/methylation domain-containing protein [Acidobacteriota bacterium]HPB28449.1 prepilin-type N-terminal cleavage/methylation domain-containing protein [Acidobacteriota bacterium]HQO26408.1 prepilin-type N-terminal cleavage/methylation domain-con